MCYKRCTDKKYLDSEWYNEEVVFRYPNGSVRQIEQRTGEVIVGTIDFDKDGNEMQFKSRDERTDWVHSQLVAEEQRKWELLDPEYKPKDVIESVEILLYKAQDMRLHNRVEELEKLRCNLLQSNLPMNEITMNWEDIHWTWGGGTSKDKEIHDEAMEIIEYWNEKLFNLVGGDNVKDAMNKVKEDMKQLKYFFNLHEPPKGSPPIVSPKINFEGNIYLFALKKHNQYAENINKPEYKWATTRMTFFRWLKFQWTINGKDFTAEQLKSALSTGIEEGLIDPKDKKKIPKREQ